MRHCPLPSPAKTSGTKNHRCPSLQVNRSAACFEAPEVTLMARQVRPLAAEYGAPAMTVISFTRRGAPLAIEGTVCSRARSPSLLGVTVRPVSLASATSRALTDGRDEHANVSHVAPSTTSPSHTPRFTITCSFPRTFGRIMLRLQRPSNPERPPVSALHYSRLEGTRLPNEHFPRQVRFDVSRGRWPLRRKSGRNSWSAQHSVGEMPSTRPPTRLLMCRAALR